MYVCRKISHPTQKTSYSIPYTAWNLAQVVPFLFLKYSISRNTGFGTSSFSSGDFWACFCGWWQSPLATPKSLPSVTGSPLVLALAVIEQSGVPTCSIANAGRSGVFSQALGVGGPAQLHFSSIRPAPASYCRGSERKVLRACMLDSAFSSCDGTVNFRL